MPGKTADGRGAGGPATIRAVAEAVGAHPSTVSRVLNTDSRRSKGSASPELAARIREAAANLNYQPNPHAANLRTQRSRLVGVLVPRLSDIVLATVYESINAAAAQAGLSTVVTHTNDLVERQRAATRMMLAHRVDGLIAADADLDGRHVGEITARGLPLVLTLRHAPGCVAATIDDYLGGRLVADHFLERGFTRVAVLAGVSFASTSRERTAGFVDRYAEAGLPVGTDQIVPLGIDAPEGRRGTTELLSRGRTPEAIFAVSDFGAIGAMGVLRDKGLRPGIDVALAGFHDTEVAAELPIALTTVSTPLQRMGAEALRLLTEMLAEGSAESVRLAPKLIVRASSDPSFAASRG